MTNDRELLELAAKAAGIGDVDFDGCVAGYYPYNFDMESGEPEWWNPLTDDGDALRLAVKLKFSLSIEGNVSLVHNGDGIFEEQAKDFGDDSYAATRRAIVRAAAALGGGNG